MTPIEFIMWGVATALVIALVGCVIALFICIYNLIKAAE